MLRRSLSALLTVLLGVGAATLVAPGVADAVDDCELVLEPSITRAGNGFNAFFQGDLVRASDLISFSSSTTNAIADANDVLAQGPPPQVQAFYRAAIEWLVFLDSGECANAVEYPGPFENMPASPASPYGFGKSPVAAPSVPSFTVTQPTAVRVPDPLAHSGSESAILLYFGFGLVAFGALALGGRRTYLQDTEL